MSISKTRRQFLSVTLGGVIGAAASLSTGLVGRLSAQDRPHADDELDEKQNISPLADKLLTHVDDSAPRKTLLAIARDFENALSTKGMAAGAVSGTLAHVYMQNSYIQEGIADKRYQVYGVPLLGNGTWISPVMKEATLGKALQTPREFSDTLAEKYKLEKEAADQATYILARHFADWVDIRHVLIPTIATTLTGAIMGARGADKADAKAENLDFPDSEVMIQERAEKKSAADIQNTQSPPRGPWDNLP